MFKKWNARSIHRYLGFFLVGIMSVYALSGSVLIFRRTNFMKSKTEHRQVFAPGLNVEQLRKTMKNPKLGPIESVEGKLNFKGGSYDPVSGETHYATWDYYPGIKQMVHMHKASTERAEFVIYLVFAASLLFFALSSFWMFKPTTKFFKTGVKVSLAGIVFTVLVLALV